MLDGAVAQKGGAVLVALALIACWGCSSQAPEPASTPAPAPSNAAPPSEKPASEAPAPAVATPAADAPASWPRFHGPDGQNHSPDTGLLAQWPAEGPALAWKTSGIGAGYASVTIGPGRIYTSGNVNDKTTISALDLDGHLAWQVDAGPGWTTDYPGTRGTPTLDGERLYHESPLGDVVCLNAQNGEKIWSVNVLEKFGAKNIKWALAESLLIDGEHVIVSPGGPKVSLAALDKRSGETVWTAPSTEDEAGYASPILAEVGGLRIVMTLNSKALIGVNADSGELLWHYPHTTEYDVNATMPIYHDGQVFISTGYSAGAELLQITVDGKKASVKQVWASKELDNHHGGVILADGELYGASHQANKGKWICLDWKTGDKRYAETGVGKGSATWADGMLCTLSEKGDVGLVPATPEGHKVLSRFKLPKTSDDPTWAHPVVCGGRLYLRHADWLYAYAVK